MELRLCHDTPSLFLNATTLPRKLAAQPALGDQHLQDVVFKQLSQDLGVRPADRKDTSFPIPGHIAHYSVEIGMTCETLRYVEWAIYFTPMSAPVKLLREQGSVRYCT